MASYAITVRARGVHVNCSQFIMTAVLRHCLETAIEIALPSAKDTLSVLRDSTNVDDCISSVESDANAFKQLDISTLKNTKIKLN